MKPQTTKELSLKEQLELKRGIVPAAAKKEDELIKTIKDLSKAVREASGEAAGQLRETLDTMVDLLATLKAQKEQPINVEVNVPAQPQVVPTTKWVHKRVEMGKWVSERVG